MYVSQPKKNLSCFSLLLKKNLSCFSLLLHILCLTAKEKSPYFSLLSHTLIIYLEGGNTLFFFFFFLFPHSSLWLSSCRWQHVAFSSLASLFEVGNPLFSPPLLIFFKAETLCSLLLGYWTVGPKPLNSL